MVSYDERGVHLYKFILRSHDELFSFGVCYALLYNPRTPRSPRSPHRFGHIKFERAAVRMGDGERTEKGEKAYVRINVLFYLFFWGEAAVAFYCDVVCRLPACQTPFKNVMFK